MEPRIRDIMAMYCHNIEGVISASVITNPIKFLILRLNYGFLGSPLQWTHNSLMICIKNQLPACHANPFSIEKCFVAKEEEGGSWYQLDGNEKNQFVLPRITV